jgi:peptidoglycan/xylan/chitin deacetylase (PgdA/CDA1 family)/GT2 family glycosyltransferase
VPARNRARVSVVIPARNATETISETLQSLLVQSSDHWEAIVVDDGSTDETAALASRFAGCDARIRCVSQNQGGVSAARNKGVELARSDWVLFLDADDWLLPAYLERMHAVLESSGNVDAAFCGAARVTPDGLRVKEDYHDEAGDMFHYFAQWAVFPIHACVVRKSIVQSVGGFDRSLRTCEDWDLWQRIARTGARFFGVAREVLALYRMRPRSASMDHVQMLRDGLRVITQGHSPDPRVSKPEPANIKGIPQRDLASTKLGYACWCAGLPLGRGEDARHLLGLLEDERDVQLEPYVVAHSIFRAALISAGLAPTQWGSLWHRIEGRVDDFLLALEDHTQSSGLARGIRSALEANINEPFRTTACTLPMTTHTVGVDITEPIPDVRVPGPIERLQCLVEAEGEYLGKLDLPVCDGLVPAYVIADAISAQLAWPILDLFFGRTIYNELAVKHEKDGLSLWRENVRLTEALPIDEQTLREQAHDRAGWTVLLQEIWGRTDWPQSHFYDSQAVNESAPRQSTEDGWVTVEASDSVPDIRASEENLQVVFTVGGVAIGRVNVPVKRVRLRAHELRVALTSASKMELCRTAVREALIGRPLTEPLSLRARLASARDARSTVEDLDPTSIKGFSLAPGSVPAFGPVKSANERLLVLGRREGEIIETSVSRRAMLPAANYRGLLDLAKRSYQPTVQYYEHGARPERVMYAPELISHSSRTEQSLPRNNVELTARLLLRRIRTPLHHLHRLKRLARSSAQSQHETSTRQEATTAQLPILMYHSVSATGSSGLTRYRVTPEAFEEQLQYLHDAGFRTATLEEWRLAMEAKRPLSGRAIGITFDDGYRDFLVDAWPLLAKYGFSATVFLVAGRIGQSNEWDQHSGQVIPLLEWDEIRELQMEGIEFGSHSLSHRVLTELPVQEVAREIAHSKKILEQGLGTHVRVLAYPYGASDNVIHHLAGACGFTCGLTCRMAPSQFDDLHLALPRIEITGYDRLRDFITKVGMVE